MDVFIGIALTLLAIVLCFYMVGSAMLAGSLLSGIARTLTGRTRRSRR